MSNSELELEEPNRRRNWKENTIQNYHRGERDRIMGRKGHGRESQRPGDVGAKAAESSVVVI